LGRDAALKILPAEVQDDPKRRQRFELEPRPVAGLDHSNIIAASDVGFGLSTHRAASRPTGQKVVLNRPMLH
jgi:hypothetical protein